MSFDLVPSDPHPTEDDALRIHVLGERDRIARLSRVREFVLGFQDGLLVPLAVATGLAGATVTTSTVSLQARLIDGASAGVGYVIGEFAPRLFES